MLVDENGTKLPLLNVDYSGFNKYEVAVMELFEKRTVSCDATVLEGDILSYCAKKGIGRNDVMECVESLVEKKMIEPRSCGCFGEPSYRFLEESKGGCLRGC